MQGYVEIWSLIKYYLEFKIIFILSFSLWKCPDPIWKRVCLCVSSSPPLQKTPKQGNNKEKTAKKHKNPQKTKAHKKPI